MKRRTLALAGLAQAIEVVLQTAADGHADDALVAPATASLFAIDAPSTEAVFGGLPPMRSALQLLIAQLEGSGPRRASANRIAITVLMVERKLVAQPRLLAALSKGIENARPKLDAGGELAAEVQQQLGDLYAATISTLTPRVLVHGDPAQLAQSVVVGRIRCALLAAVRAAVLWRQLDGSWWDLLLRRRAITQAARELLAEIENPA
jgi:high frequency lysogenization protein